ERSRLPRICPIHMNKPIVPSYKCWKRPSGLTNLQIGKTSTDGSSAVGKGQVLTMRREGRGKEGGGGGSLVWGLGGATSRMGVGGTRHPGCLDRATSITTGRQNPIKAV